MTMGLIDTDKFVVDAPVSSSLEFSAGVLYVLNKLDAAPTIDAVPVVRCKDCKYFKTWLCQNEDNYDDWFCADGERKDGDGNG